MSFRQKIIFKIINFIWPKIGLTRFFKYLLIKIKRMPGRPHSIACGFACGVLVSFTPFVGFHLILSAILAFILKGSIVASFLGTIVGNPWTFPIIWFSSYRLGLILMGIYKTEFEIQAVNFIHLFQNFFGALIQLNVNKFKAEIMPVWLPMMIGSIPLGLIGWFSAYLPLKKMIVSYQKHREMVMERKRLGLSKKKELQYRLKNIYKKIKRIIRNRYKLKWKKNAKKRADLRGIIKQQSSIKNKKILRLDRCHKKIYKKALAKKIKRLNRRKKSKKFSYQRRLKKLKGLFS